MSYKKDAFYQVFTIIFGLLVLSIGGAFLLNILYYLVLANFDFDSNYRKPVAEVLAPKGRFVEVDGKRMHIYCSGDGEETAVLEADKYNWSIYWTAIQNEVSKFARVCSYDRMGVGWSEGDVQNDEETIETLHKLLMAAEIPGPYILAGHSWGAQNILNFTEKYPDEVKALITYEYPYEREINIRDKYKSNELDYPLLMISSPLNGLNQNDLEYYDKIRTDLIYDLPIWQADSNFLQIDKSDRQKTFKAISSAINYFENM